jgi:hypothetical protein
MGGSVFHRTCAGPVFSFAARPWLAALQILDDGGCRPVFARIGLLRFNKFQIE